MKRRLLYSGLGLCALLATGATALHLQERGRASADLPALPGAPAPALALAYARPFQLAEPYAHVWRAEQPAVTAGYLVVLTCDPDLLVPRETFEPVLFAGSQTVERVNKGHLDGHLVAIVPGTPDADGWPREDLAALPVWFGTPELPERVDAARIAAELAAANAVGVAPFSATERARALAAGGAGLLARDQLDLRQEAARLVLQYAPSEQDLAHGMLVPVTGR